MKIDLRIVASLLVLAGVGFWFWGKPNYLDADVALPPTPEDIAAAKRPTYIVGEHEPVIVNLAPDGGLNRYARLQVALEFEDEAGTYVGAADEEVSLKNAALHEELDQQRALILDAIISVFGELSSQEALAVEFRPHLKDELLQAINASLRERRVAELSFVTLVVQ